MATKKRLIDAYLNGEVPKIKTHFAEIIVSGQTEKPYYNILFIDPQTREYEVCFGSYSLENVRKWLSEEFEIVDAPTVDAVEVVYCDNCVNHGNCLPEDVFRIARVEKPYCCAGKIDGGGYA